MKSFLVTKEGYTALQEKYDMLTKERPAAVMDLKKAREMGDLSENGYYKAAKMKLGSIDRELRHTHLILKQAVIKQPSSTTHIDIGSTVHLKTNEKDYTYTLVGDFEADPSKGYISYQSPLGKILIGKKVGETVVVQTPGGQKKYTIHSL